MEWLFNTTSKNYNIEEYLIISENVLLLYYSKNIFEAGPQKWIYFMILISFFNLSLYFTFVY